MILKKVIWEISNGEPEVRTRWHPNTRWSWETEISPEKLAIIRRIEVRRLR